MAVSGESVTDNPDAGCEPVMGVGHLSELRIGRG